MPPRDRYHNHVRNALIKDGWTITDDPLHLKWGGNELYVDLGAEQLLGAEKGERKIAVEIKTFGGPSEVRDLQAAIGQYVIYREALDDSQPDRELYLAVSEEVYADVFMDGMGKLLIERRRAQLIVFEPEAEEIRQWKP
jgi:hypothetical protein